MWLALFPPNGTLQQKAETHHELEFLPIRDTIKFSSSYTQMPQSVCAV